MKFTVIIPVYNVEEYLEECLGSVLSYDGDFEVVLVDDGSTDSSGAICDGAARSDGRVRAIHRENGGSAAARNTGLDNALGDYVLFVDSDDAVYPEAIRKIEEKIAQTGYPDVVFLEAEKFYPDGKREPMDDGYSAAAIDGKSADEVLSFLASCPKFPGSACTKAVKRSFIEENKIRFREGEYVEDIDFVCRVLACAKTFAYCPSPYYRYRQKRKGSNTDLFALPQLECLLGTVERYSARRPQSAREEYFNSFMAYETGVAVLDFAALKKEDRKAVRDRLKGVVWLLKSRGAKGRGLYALAKTLGVGAASIAASLYYRRK